MPDRSPLTLPCPYLPGCSNWAAPTGRPRPVEPAAQKMPPELSRQVLGASWGRNQQEKVHGSLLLLLLLLFVCSVRVQVLSSVMSSRRQARPAGSVLPASEAGANVPRASVYPFQALLLPPPNPQPL